MLNSSVYKQVEIDAEWYSFKSHLCQNCKELLHCLIGARMANKMSSLGLTYCILFCGIVYEYIYYSCALPTTTATEYNCIYSFDLMFWNIENRKAFFPIVCVSHLVGLFNLTDVGVGNSKLLISICCFNLFLVCLFYIRT